MFQRPCAARGSRVLGRQFGICVIEFAQGEFGNDLGRVFHRCTPGRSKRPSWKNDGNSIHRWRSVLRLMPVEGCARAQRRSKRAFYFPVRFSLGRQSAHKEGGAHCAHGPSGAGWETTANGERCISRKKRIGPPTRVERRSDQLSRTSRLNRLHDPGLFGDRRKANGRIADWNPGKIRPHSIWRADAVLSDRMAQSDSDRRRVHQ